MGTYTIDGCNEMFLTLQEAKKHITVGTNYLTYNMLHKLAFNFWGNNKRVKTDRNTILNIKIQ